MQLRPGQIRRIADAHQMQPGYPDSQQQVKKSGVAQIAHAWSGFMQKAPLGTWRLLLMEDHGPSRRLQYVRYGSATKRFCVGFIQFRELPMYSQLQQGVSSARA